MGGLALVLMLAGCASAESPTPSPTAIATSTPTPTPTPTVEAPRATSAVLSLDGLVILDQNSAEFRSASFADPDAVVALVSELMGSTPEPVDNRKFGINYDWPTVRINVNFNTALISLESADLAGLPVATSEGIHVGSTRDEVLALTHVESTHDGDGDGKPDNLGIEPRTVPGTESLSYPGQEGTDFIRVYFSGDTVVEIVSPTGDWRDI